MVQDTITDHIFYRPQFVFISSHRFMFDINRKLFSFSIEWWHSFGYIKSRIQIHPNKKLVYRYAVLSNQRCHDVTVSTVLQRNATDLASARTTKRTSCLRTDIQISKIGALVIVYVYWASLRWASSSSRVFWLTFFDQTQSIARVFNLSEFSSTYFSFQLWTSLQTQTSLESFRLALS